MARVRTHLVFLFLAGCFPAGSGADGGGGGGGVVGFGKPTLEVTINGVHFGPAAPQVGSGADLATTRDSLTGRILDTTLQISGVSAVNASCNLGFERTGDGLAPFFATGYQLSEGGVGGTADGTVAPIAAETMSTPQGTWQCAGSDCSGAALVLTYLQPDHLEGTLSGTFQDTGGAGAASVVCSFYLPMRSFSQ